MLPLLRAEYLRIRLLHGPVQRRLSALIAFTRTLLLRGGLVLVMPVFFGVDGVWWSVAAAELLGVVLSVVLLVLMRRRYHYA